MAVLTADFETGTATNTVATTDTGSGSAWNVVAIGASESFVYDTTHVAHGSLAGKIVCANSAAGTYGAWSTSLGTVTNHYGRIYLWASSLSSGPRSIVPYSGTNACCYIQFSGGKVQIRDQAFTLKATSTNSGSTSQWIRIEWHVVHSATVGSVEVSIFNTADSVTATETFSASSINTLASANSIRLGNSVTIGQTIWIDNAVANAASYPGPFPVNTTAPSVSGSTPVGSVLSTTDGSWNTSGTFNYTYQWTRDGSNIGAATSSTYTTVSGDIGHAIGCTVTATGQQATNETASQASSNTITAAPSAASWRSPLGTKVPVKRAP